MKYELLIRKHNILPHIDIEKDIQKVKNGRLSFTLRVNNGNIVDKNVTEFINLKRKYLGVNTILGTKFTISYGLGDRSVRSGVRPDDGEPRNRGRESKFNDNEYGSK